MIPSCEHTLRAESRHSSANGMWEIHSFGYAIAVLPTLPSCGHIYLKSPNVARTEKHITFDLSADNNIEMACNVWLCWRSCVISSFWSSGFAYDLLQDSSLSCVTSRCVPVTTHLSPGIQICLGEVRKIPDKLMTMSVVPEYIVVVLRDIEYVHCYFETCGCNYFEVAISLKIGIRLTFTLEQHHRLACKVVPTKSDPSYFLKLDVRKIKLEGGPSFSRISLCISSYFSFYFSLSFLELQQYS